MPTAEEVVQRIRAGRQRKQKPGEVFEQARGRKDVIDPPAPKRALRPLRPNEQQRVAAMRRCVADLLGVAEGLINVHFTKLVQDLIAGGRIKECPSAIEHLLNGDFGIPPLVRGKVPLGAAARTRQMCGTLALLDAVIRYVEEAGEGWAALATKPKKPGREQCPVCRHSLRADNSCAKCGARIGNPDE